MIKTIRRLLNFGGAACGIFSGYFWFLSARISVDLSENAPKYTQIAVDKMNHLSQVNNYWAAYFAAALAVFVGISQFFDD